MAPTPGRFELVYSDSDESDSSPNVRTRPQMQKNLTRRTETCLPSPVPVTKLNGLHYCEACDLFWDSNDRRALLGEAHDGSRMYVALDPCGLGYQTFWSKDGSYLAVNGPLELKTLYNCAKVVFEPSPKMSIYDLYLSVQKSQLSYWLHVHERDNGHHRTESDKLAAWNLPLEQTSSKDARTACQLWNAYNERTFDFNEPGLQRVQIAYARVFYPLRTPTVQQLQQWRQQASEHGITVEELPAFRNACLDANGVNRRELLEQMLLWTRLAAQQFAAANPGSNKRVRPLLTIGLAGDAEEWEDFDDENQQLMKARKKKRQA